MGLQRWSPVEPHGPVLLSVWVTVLEREVESEVPRWRGETKSLRAREGQWQRIVEGPCTE